MIDVYADGSARSGSIPGVGFGRQPDVYDGRPQGRPTVVAGQCAAKVPSGAATTPGSHTGLNRPPAAPVSTQNMSGRDKARSTVLHGVGSLIVVSYTCEGVASEQASEHQQRGCTPTVRPLTGDWWCGLPRELSFCMIGLPQRPLMSDWCCETDS